MPVIEDTSQIGCRILNRMDLIALQYLEWVISETVLRKPIFVHNIVDIQFEQICSYFKKEKNIEKEKLRLQHLQITTIKMRKMS